MRSIPNPNRRQKFDFGETIHAFLLQDGLLFSNVLSAETVAETFARFTQPLTGISTHAIVLWAFLSQVLRDGKEASCQSAVARIISHLSARSCPAPTSDTGDYCRARAKMPEAALKELVCHVAEEAENQVDPKWLWKGRHAKLIDGFTFMMPDTVKNQKVYPQHTAQKAGIGFPIARVVSVARRVKYQINIPGRKQDPFVILTTLAQESGEQAVSYDDIADLYPFRWNAELDIRNIKTFLNLHHVRCKSPEMVRREFWTTLLAYNLNRVTLANSAALHHRHPRELSFVSACQFVRVRSGLCAASK